MSDTPDIVDFLRARLDEEYQYAYHAQGLLGIKQPWWKWHDLKAQFPSLTRRDAQHIEVHSPAKAIADIKFKRDLLDLWIEAGKRKEFTSQSWVLLREVVYAIAALYSDHPDHNPKWKPIFGATLEAPGD